MSWNDPCSKCGEPRRECECKSTIILETKEKKSGFFELDKSKVCKHPEHNVPMFLYIPSGKGYRHVCPGCQEVINVIAPQISFSSIH